MSDGAPDDLDLVTRTVLAEAGNQGPIGQAAVAAVIRNRMQSRRMSAGDVVLERNQFEPWNPGSGNDPMRLDANSPRYAQARNIVQSVFSGSTPDPTRGATHFANVSTVRQRNGGTVGNHRWINPANQTAQIGGHTFFAPEGRVTGQQRMDPMTAFQTNPAGGGAIGPIGGVTGQQPSPVMAYAPQQGLTPSAPSTSGALAGAPMGAPFQMPQPQQARGPILGRMLFGDGGLPGFMNRAIPTPNEGRGLLGGLFGGNTGAMPQSPAAPAANLFQGAGAGGGPAAGGSALGSMLSALFALI